MTKQLRRLRSSAQRMPVVAGLTAMLLIGAMGAHVSGGGLVQRAVADAALPVTVPTGPITDIGWAVCAAGGGLVRAKGVLSCNRVAFNLYRVVFPVPVSACSYLATIGLPGPGFPPPGEISVAGDPSPFVINVATYNGAGASTPGFFHIEVNC
jgi:hypothetical protein